MVIIRNYYLYINDTFNHMFNNYNLHDLCQILSNSRIISLTASCSNYMYYRMSYLFKLKGYLNHEILLLTEHTNCNNIKSYIDLDEGIGRMFSSLSNLNIRTLQKLNIDQFIKTYHNITFVKSLKSSHILNILKLRPKIVQIIDYQSSRFKNLPNSIKKIYIHRSFGNDFDILPKSVTSLFVQRWQPKRCGAYCPNNVQLPNNIKKIGISYQLFYNGKPAQFSDNIEIIKIGYIDSICDPKKTDFLPKSLKVIYYRYCYDHQIISNIPKNIKLIKY